MTIFSTPINTSKPPTTQRHSSMDHFQTQSKTKTPRTSFLPPWHRAHTPSEHPHSILSPIFIFFSASQFSGSLLSHPGYLKQGKYNLSFSLIISRRLSH